MAVPEIGGVRHGNRMTPLEHFAGMRRVGALLAAVVVAWGCVPSGSVAPLADLDADAPFASLGSRAGKGFKVFRGIQHTHVGENGDDGQGTLAEAYTYGRDRADLDFMAVSSHAHMIDDGGYRRLQAAAAEFTRPGKFIALVAQEWSSISKGGHINIVEANARCDVPNGDWGTFYSKWLPSHPEVGFAQFNHPHPENPKEFGGAAFPLLESSKSSRAARSGFVGMALVNGPSKYAGEDMRGRPDSFDMGRNGLNFEEEFKEFLNRGWRLGAVADADNHTKNWGTATPTRTGVWAKALGKADIVTAFRSRRTFAAWDQNVTLWFSIGGQPMGAEIDAAGDLPIEAVISDPDTDIARLELLGDLDGPGGRPAEVLARQNVGGRAFRWAFTLPAPSREAYFFVKAVYPGERAWAWSSPVWVRPGAVSGVSLPYPGSQPEGDF